MMCYFLKLGMLKQVLGLHFLKAFLTNTNICKVEVYSIHHAWRWMGICQYEPSPIISLIKQ